MESGRRVPRSALGRISVGIADRVALVTLGRLTGPPGRLWKGGLAAIAAALALLAGPGAVAGESAVAAGTMPGRSCESLSSLTLPDTTVDSATTVAAAPTNPEYCAVELSVHNPPAEDAVRVGVFLPTSTWNGRFESVGGGGFEAGDPTVSCTKFVRVVFQPCPLQQGYATAATNAGHTGSTSDGSFAMNPDGTLNWQRINDFGYLGIHEMTATAKAVMAAYYGQGPKYSYFNGCSTGGRQGIMEAQRFPSDYDGIAAGAPAINFTKLTPAQLWGELEMNLAEDFIPGCKFEAATNAAVTACDGLDHVQDGIISDWQECDFDARSLVGTVTPCGTITATDAELIDKIWAGPRDPNGNFLWYGPLRGASLGTGPNAAFGALDQTVTAPDGTTTGVPSEISVQWYQYWLAQNPDLDWRTITYNQFVQFFQQSVSEFGQATATDDPNLTAFREAGGKLLLWHGTSDQLIPPQPTVDYYNQVVQAMGGLQGTRQFARLFLAPGVQHCASAAGPAPANPLATLVDWVEKHKAPAELPAVKTDPSGNVLMTRPLCMYPLVARYKGTGSINTANSFVCSTHF